LNYFTRYASKLNATQLVSLVWQKAKQSNHDVS
jgi:hypothetical protein